LRRSQQKWTEAAKLQDDAVCGDKPRIHKQRFPIGRSIEPDDHVLALEANLEPTIRLPMEREALNGCSGRVGAGAPFDPVLEKQAVSDGSVTNGHRGS
jgi:hypothetical protein